MNFNIKYLNILIKTDESSTLNKPIFNYFNYFRNYISDSMYSYMD